MGTDLYQLGNHKIRFKERQFKELATDIKTTLDNTILPNAEFLKHFALHCHSDKPRRIREINTKRHWAYSEEDEYYNFKEYQEIKFDGPLGLKLTFGQSVITFWDPPFRYSHWFELKDDVHRDEWRKYMQHIVNLFEGDRVVYLADNSHLLEEYICYDGTFEEMENALLEKFGKPKKTFKEVAEDIDNSYFIDDFNSIDRSQSEPLEAYNPLPDDISSTDYDLKVYSVKDNLKELNFQNEVLLHKRIDCETHFIHLATVDGLLCVHSGIVGGQENLEVTLDKYAPFTYDSLEEKNEKDGYGNQWDISFVIKFNGWENINSWSEALAEFEIELLWQGLGQKDGGIYDDDKREEWFCSVDEELAMKLLLDLGKKYDAKGKIEIYREIDVMDILENDDNKSVNRILIYEQ